MLGIIIPTKNHSDFVIRQLNYYASVDCPYTVYIGDSSDERHAERILSKINGLKGQLKVVYRWVDPGLVSHAALKHIVDIVEEKYVTYAGDDDLFVPDGLRDCIDFLEGHPHYSSAQGQAVVFGLDRDGAYGEIEILGRYFIKECESETPAERLSSFLNNYWVLDFSVHRTVDYREACNCRDPENPRFLSDGSFTEILVGCLALIRGKSKRLDRLYLFRQVGSHRFGLSRANFLDWISQPNWQLSFDIFHDTVTEALEWHADMTRDSASDLVRASFSNYLVNSMECRPPPSALTQKIRLLKGTIEQSPIARFLYDQVRQINPGSRRDLRLERLLRPSSPYHHDFMPVYRAITSEGVS